MKEKKTLRWILWSIIGTLMLLITFVTFLFLYAEGHVESLRTYQRSIENLPEVREVLEVSRFVGLEEYIVAEVELTNGDRYYYFVKEGLVEGQVAVGDLISRHEAAEVALTLLENNTVRQIHLGIHQDDIIYEVRLSGAYHVIIDARTGAVLFYFG